MLKPGAILVSALLIVSVLHQGISYASVFDDWSQRLSEFLGVASTKPRAVSNETGYNPDAEIQQNTQPASYEGDDTSGLVFSTFDIIMRVREEKKAKTEAQRQALNRETVEVYVGSLADRIGDRNGVATAIEISNALVALEGVVGRIADKYEGNNDGIGDIDEINRLNSRISNYPGYEILLEMMIEYRRYRGRSGADAGSGIVPASYEADQTTITPVELRQMLQENMNIWCSEAHDYYSCVETVTESAALLEIGEFQEAGEKLGMMPEGDDVMPAMIMPAFFVLFAVSLGVFTTANFLKGMDEKISVIKNDLLLNVCYLKGKDDCSGGIPSNPGKASGRMSLAELKSACENSYSEGYKKKCSVAGTGIITAGYESGAMQPAAVSWEKPEISMLGVYIEKELKPPEETGTDFLDEDMESPARVQGENDAYSQRNPEAGWNDFKRLYRLPDNRLRYHYLKGYLSYEVEDACFFAGESDCKEGTDMGRINIMKPENNLGEFQEACEAAYSRGYSMSCTFRTELPYDRIAAVAGMQEVEKVEAEEVDGEKVYSVTGRKKDNFLGFIPVESTIVAEVNEDGEVLEVHETPWWMFWA